MGTWAVHPDRAYQNLTRAAARAIIKTPRCPPLPVAAVAVVQQRDRTGSSKIYSKESFAIVWLLLTPSAFWAREVAMTVS
jgi:hypothetical protein